MTKEDRLYLAGLIDGIGTFFANAKKGKVRAGVRRMYPQYGIEVVGTHKEFMRHLAELMGGEARPKAQVKGRVTQSYVIRLYSENAIQFISEVIPYLRLKKKRAEATRELHELVKKEPKTAKDGERIGLLMQQLAKRGKPEESAKTRGTQTPAPGKAAVRSAPPASGRAPQAQPAPAKLTDAEFRERLKRGKIPHDYLLTERQKRELEEWRLESVREMARKQAGTSRRSR